MTRPNAGLLQFSGWILVTQRPQRAQRKYFLGFIVFSDFMAQGFSMLTIRVTLLPGI